MRALDEFSQPLDEPRRRRTVDDVDGTRGRDTGVAPANETEAPDGSDQKYVSVVHMPGVETRSRSLAYVYEVGDGLTLTDASDGG